MTIRLPKGHRVYAISDIHGMLGLLDVALAMIDRDLEANPADTVTEVFLGDYVDRGPDSRGVIERLAVPPQDRERICLMGNHEDAMRLGLYDGTMMSRWLGFGGMETCLSFGIDAWSMARDPIAVQAKMQSVLEPEHRAFLDDLKLYHRIGDTFFVHAGIRPGVPLADQDSHDFIWIREDFLSYRGPLPVHVVHGHTPVDKPTSTTWRTNIDTGAVYGGPLTVAIFEDQSVRFLSVTANSLDQSGSAETDANAMYRDRSWLGRRILR